MNASQKTIKYIGMAFAILLSCGIIYSVLSVGVNVLDLFLGGNSAEQFDKSYTSIKQVKVDNGTGKLIIKSGDSFRVVGENVDRKFRSKVHGSTLEIRNENSVRGLWNSTNKKNRCVLTVYIPKDTELSSLEIDAGVGNTEISGISSRKVDIDMGAGNVTLSEVTAQALVIDGGVGNAIGENLSFERAEIDGGVGNIRLTPILGNRDDYSIDIDSGVGSINLNGNRVSGDMKVKGTTGKLLRIDGGVGNIELEFSMAS